MRIHTHAHACTHTRTCTHTHTSTQYTELLTLKEQCQEGLEKMWRFQHQQGQTRHLLIPPGNRWRHTKLQIHTIYKLTLTHRERERKGSEGGNRDTAYKLMPVQYVVAIILTCCDMDSLLYYNHIYGIYSMKE